jgi:hypothetical protein
MLPRRQDQLPYLLEMLFPVQLAVFNFQQDPAQPLPEVQCTSKLELVLLKVEMLPCQQAVAAQVDLDLWLLQLVITLELAVGVFLSLLASLLMVLVTSISLPVAVI